ncbi:MAG: P-loop NTPase [Oscillospiraceae bacterium]|nr:P-loop NTPase [Oscillospiraceae bacterium]
MSDESKRLQKEHEEKYMKYMADFDACGGDFSSCSGKCDSCSSKCGEENKDDGKTPKKAARIVAVFSGKGGTGKSLMTCLLADKLQAMGKKVAVLDADPENPTIHYLYGKVEPCNAEGQNILPMKADSGVEFISMGNIEKQADQPLLSYGKDVAVSALYFYLNVKWSEDLDFMLIDMPSGIGDVPLQIGTIIPFDGAVAVSNPSDLCDYLVTKSVNLMKMIMIPVLGVIENKASLPLEDGAVMLGTDPAEHAKALKLPLLATVPLSLELSVMADFGRVCDAEVPELDAVTEILVQ